VVTRRARTAGRDAGDGLPQCQPSNPGVAETPTNQMLVAARLLGLSRADDLAGGDAALDLRLSDVWPWRLLRRSRAAHTCEVARLSFGQAVALATRSSSSKAIQRLLCLLPPESSWSLRVGATELGV
jgi:hypothetical protein